MTQFAKSIHWGAICRPIHLPGAHGEMTCCTGLTLECGPPDECGIRPEMYLRNDREINALVEHIKAHVERIGVVGNAMDLSIVIPGISPEYAEESNDKYDYDATNLNLELCVDAAGIMHLGYFEPPLLPDSFAALRTQSAAHLLCAALSLLSTRMAADTLRLGRRNPIAQIKRP